MARNAHPEVTERRILEAARDLFMEKGYEKTSIQNIVDRLGDLSKGAIYHHFKSKEAILDRLNSTDWDYSQGERDRIMARNDLNGLQKLRALFTVAINNEEHQKLNEAGLPFLDDPTTLASNLNFWATELPKHWLPIIEEGMRDGSIPTEYPQEAAELISLLANYWLLTRFYPATRAELKHRIQCLATMLNAINIPVFNDDLINLTTDFYAQFDNQSPKQKPHN
ncbi:tetR family transcriptional regulator [Bifidobacterium saguini DSM 23967]|uniref:TetR family transcriptional regulator n=2 Tax=Bifidobacterium saguini TaxID=762210 RepID=A0A087D9A0_9BIFI|nr:TetR/AcrR family transcriptional regulator [Bifidobacterium saguini]KFI92100.1 tetR family transcriptional regulator [Bifidobacterium saguini DSM 23967]QTB90105.1 TetR/AcrR family transcriptional regulator [Bifidobacterium saguini]